MTVGIYDVGGCSFPNLPLMKISAWHKQRGDSVEIWQPLLHYDRVYVSKVFGDEYSQLTDLLINADEVIYGGTGFAISVVDGKEVFTPEKDKPLSYEIEHIYPDYSIYPELTQDKAFGFLTRGCPNNCSFCIVSKKEGRQSVKVADLSEFWNGQKEIVLMDANLLACKDRADLLQQLIDSKAWIDFCQGIDARFITDDVAIQLSKIKKKMTHFAFDFMKNEEAIRKGLAAYARHNKINFRRNVVYILTNYNTTTEEDVYRIKAVQELGFAPDVRVYRKSTAPQVTRDLQHWCNNRWIYRSTTFADFVPRKDGISCGERYGITDI